MVIELRVVQFWKIDYKIARPRSGSAICDHKFDFSPKLHDTKFNFHFIIFILKSLNIFVNLKRFCLQKAHLRFLPVYCSIATISEQDELYL
jgi:hypothetical protein